MGPNRRQAHGGAGELIESKLATGARGAAEAWASAQGAVVRSAAFDAASIRLTMLAGGIGSNESVTAHIKGLSSVVSTLASTVQKQTEEMAEMRASLVRLSQDSALAHHELGALGRQLSTESGARGPGAAAAAAVASLAGRAPAPVLAGAGAATVVTPFAPAAAGSRSRGCSSSHGGGGGGGDNCSGGSDGDRSDGDDDGDLSGGAGGAGGEGGERGVANQTGGGNKIRVQGFKAQLQGGLPLKSALADSVLSHQLAVDTSTTVAAVMNRIITAGFALESRSVGKNTDLDKNNVTNLSEAMSYMMAVATAEEREKLKVAEVAARQAASGVSGSAAAEASAPSFLVQALKLERRLVMRFEKEEFDASGKKSAARDFTLGSFCRRRRALKKATGGTQLADARMKSFLTNEAIKVFYVALAQPGRKRKCPQAAGSAANQGVGSAEGPSAGGIGAWLPLPGRLPGAAWWGGSSSGPAEK